MRIEVAHEMDEHNTTPMYAVRYDKAAGKIGRTSMGWTGSRSKAEAWYREKEAAGLNPTLVLGACAGWASL